MSAAHTPGPWRAYREYLNLIEFSAPGGGDFGCIRLSQNGVNYKTGLRVCEEEQDANTVLIAAAPDMLAALQDVSKCHPRNNAICPEYVRIAREAIAKATGEAP